MKRLDGNCNRMDIEKSEEKTKNITKAENKRKKKKTVETSRTQTEKG